MLFSDAFNIRRGRRDDWFDPLLNLDTKLFIDPFLLYDHEIAEFVGSHAEIIRFFNFVLRLVAQSVGDVTSPVWRRAISLLRFPEVEELCLGYTRLGTRGLGSGGKLANQLARGLLRAINAGVVELRHFEEVEIFEEGVGADRISDATANLIRARLAAYTARVCERHHVRTEPLQTDRAVFDFDQGRWTNGIFNLPRNPVNRKPVMLVPRRYLRTLPSINAKAFWDYCFDNHNEELRRRYGEDITRNVDKRTIVAFAREHPRFRTAFVRNVEARGGAPYDLDRDPKGVYQPAVGAYHWTRANLRRIQPQNDAELANAVFVFIEEFRNFVENQRGWRLLWNDNKTPKAEDSFQALFLQSVAANCRANNIDVSAEANIGRGPVDFRMTVGYEARVLIEAKLARNTKFWQGLNRQLPKYLEAEGISEGFFLVCTYTDDDIDKLRGIGEHVQRINEQLPYRIRVVTVDGRHGPTSASRLPE